MQDECVIFLAFGYSIIIIVVVLVWFSGAYPLAQHAWCQPQTLRYNLVGGFFHLHSSIQIVVGVAAVKTRMLTEINFLGEQFARF